MSEMPSYEELLPRGRGPATMWLAIVESLEPGEVRVVDVPAGAPELHIRQSLLRAGRQHDISIVTRKRDGVLYVVRLKDEDVPE